MLTQGHPCVLQTSEKVPNAAMTSFWAGVLMHSGTLFKSNSFVPDSGCRGKEPRPPVLVRFFRDLPEKSRDIACFIFTHFTFLIVSVARCQSLQTRHLYGLVGDCLCFKMADAALQAAPAVG